MVHSRKGGGATENEAKKNVQGHDRFEGDARTREGVVVFGISSCIFYMRCVCVLLMIVQKEMRPRMGGVGVGGAGEQRVGKGCAN